MLKKLLDLQGQKRERAKQILDVCTAENRSLSDTEDSESETLVVELQKLERQISNVRALGEASAMPVDMDIQNVRGSEKDKKDIASFSFQRAINSTESGKKLDGIELEMHQEGVKELQRAGKSVSGIAIPELVLNMRSGNTVGVPGDGGSTVYTEYKGFREFYKNALILEELGTTVLTGLQGNLSYVIESSQIKASWEDEIDTASVAKPTFANLTSSPKRLSKALLYSLQLLNQTSIGIESLLQRQIAYALAFAVQDAAITGVTTVGGQGNIMGLLGNTDVPTVAMGTNGALFSYQKAVEMETSVATKDALLGNLAYLTNAGVRGALKTNQKFANSQASDTIMNADGMVNGYKTALSNYIPSNLVKGTSGAVCNAMIFGDWSQLEIHRWGAIELVVDRITKATNGQVQVVVNDFANVLCVRPTSFSKCVDIKLS